MNKKTFAAIISVLIVLPQLISASTFPSNETLQQWGEFKAKYGEKWDIVRWRDYVDALAVLHGYYSFGKSITSGEEAENISRAFIEDNKALFKIDLSKLKLSRIYEDGSDFSVTYYQYYNDIPVEDARVTVSIRKDGMRVTFSNFFYPDINISTTPTISKDEAITKAKNYFATRNSGVEASLVIIPTDRIELGKLNKSPTLRYHLAWKVKFHEKTIYVDAYNGNILMEAENLMIEVGESVSSDINKTSQINITESKIDITQNESYNLTVTKNLTQFSGANETSILYLGEDIEQNKSYYASPQTVANLTTQKSEINKIPTLEKNSLVTGKTLAVFVAILVAVLAVLLFLRRGGKSEEME